MSDFKEFAKAIDPSLPISLELKFDYHHGNRKNNLNIKRKIKKI